MRTTLYTLAKKQFEDTYFNMSRDLLIADWNAMMERGLRLNGEVAEIIEELQPDSIKTEGDRVIIPKSATRIILEICKADCIVSEYEIQATDTFFADLAANPPELKAISERLETAWKLFNKVVDTSALYHQNLPWWLEQAASCAYAGLLNPSEAQVIYESHQELEQLVVSGLVSQSQHQDAQQLLSLISNAAISNNWVLGWEYGT